MPARIVRTALQALGLLTFICMAMVVVLAVALGSWLQYETPLKRADYIVPLDGDGHRLLKAIELYKQGYAPTILLSDGFVRPPSRLADLAANLGYPRPHPFELRRKILESMHIPAKAAARFGSGHLSTKEEAEALSKHLGARTATIILVTSPYHTRRAKIIFQSTMPHCEFLVAAPPEGRLAEPWWRDQFSAQLAVSEVSKLIFFWMGGVFRSAGPAS